MLPDDDSKRLFPPPSTRDVEDLVEVLQVQESVRKRTRQEREQTSAIPAAIRSLHLSRSLEYNSADESFADAGYIDFDQSVIKRTRTPTELFGGQRPVSACTTGSSGSSSRSAAIL